MSLGFVSVFQGIRIFDIRRATFLESPVQLYARAQSNDVVSCTQFGMVIVGIWFRIQALVPAEW